MAQKEFEAVPIPEELSGRVRQGIQSGQRNYRRARRLRTAWKTLGSAAACFVLLAASLNVSPALAAAAAEVPVLGGFFRVLTVRQYETTQDGIAYQVTVPGLEGDTSLAGPVNAAIQEKVDAHLEQARRDWDEYRDAFYATGGTEEEWGGREMDVIVDYAVKYQSDTQLSFVVTLSEGWVTSSEEQYCYNLDLLENRAITLQDLLGDSWVECCNRSIQDQIEASRGKDGFSFFFPPEEGGFRTVDDSTSFYIREDGVPVVVYPKYAIAAGAAGTVEFPIEP